MIKIFKKGKKNGKKLKIRKKKKTITFMLGRICISVIFNIAKNTNNILNGS